MWIAEVCPATTIFIPSGGRKGLGLRYTSEISEMVAVRRAEPNHICNTGW